MSEEKNEKVIDTSLYEDGRGAPEVDLEEVRAEFLGKPFDYATFTMKGETMASFAKACGETAPHFTDPSAPDFRAVPNYTTRFHGTRAMPEGFPKLGLPFDGGKTVEALAPIRGGDVLTASSEIADLFEKSGRSGKMTFVVHRMRFTNQDDELVSIVDWKMLNKRG